MAKVAAGAGAGVAVITALPVFGAVGAITTTGLIVGSLIGAAAGLADEIIEAKRTTSGSGDKTQPKQPT